MRVAQLQINDFRSLAHTDPLPLGKVNTFVGPNNAGKSSVLRALYAIQNAPTAADVRIDAEQSTIQIALAGIEGVGAWNDRGELGAGRLKITVGPGGELALTLRSQAGNEYGVPLLPSKEPGHFVVPYLSKRTTAIYEENVGEANALSVAGDFTHLAAKLSRLGNPGFPFHSRYDETCKAILGFTVTAIPSENGQRPGVYLADGRTIPMDQMGDGVPNIVGLLADLAQSRGKLFLIEEPENDLHPQALKALLDLIVESSEHNQMVVSTHSNIVARHLGSAPDSKLYYVDAEPGVMPPEAVVRPVEPTPAARLAVLRELGYSFSDFDLWDGWLILEESSAERIVRDYLIPWFAPKLSRVRTLSTAGNSGVEPTFDDFNRLILFTHLEEAYRNSAWVLIDGDREGQEIVERLRSRYANWESDRFECFGESQFERYYPAPFAERVEDILALGSEERREAKKALLEEVRGWLDEDEARGRAALQETAEPVVRQLQRIESQLLS